MGEVKIDWRLVEKAQSAANAESSGTASNWASLAKRVFEVDPVECHQPKSLTKVVSFFKRSQRDIVENILRQRGLWEDPLRALATAGYHRKRRTRIEIRLSSQSSSWYSFRRSCCKYLRSFQTY